MYEIAFSGRLMPGVSAESAKEALARLFQADEQRIARLFSGRRVVIKQGVDAATAERYRSAMQRVGAIAEINEMHVEEVPMAPPPAAAPVAVPRDGVAAAFSQVQAPDFGLAPLGADLQDSYAAASAPTLDLSDYSLAPLGSDMDTRPRQAAPPAPDVSHLKVAR